MDNIPINFGILKNPLNWAIVLLMVLIAAIGAHVVTGFFSKGNDQNG